MASLAVAPAAHAGARATACDANTAVRAEHFDYRFMIGAALVLESCRVHYGYGVAEADGQPRAYSENAEAQAHAGRVNPAVVSIKR